MPSLLISLCALIILLEGFSQYLLWRQATYVAAHRAKVPDLFADSVSLLDHEKAADYAISKARLGSLSSLAGLATSLVLLVCGLDWLDSQLDFVTSPIVHNVSLVALVGAVTRAVQFPFSVYSKFVTEQKFGFNRSTPRLFVTDLVKEIALTAAIGLPLLAVLFWVMQSADSLWWLYVWFGAVVLMLAAPLIYTRIIAPLFNKFEPLTDVALVTRIETLMTRCGFQSNGLFTMDASKRSSHGNAFFIGYGRTKRIVLFDTLLDKQNPDEIEAVVAHELGHFKLKHTIQGVFKGLVTMFVLLAAIGWLCKQPWLLANLGFTHRDLGLAFTVANIVLGLVNQPITLLGNWVSRRNEFQADNYAREMVGASPMISALVNLSRDNAATLTSDPLYAMVNYSHPTVAERVRHLQA